MSEILTQTELAQALIEKAGVSSIVAKNFANVFFSIVKNQLKKSDSFNVYNFGTFKKTWIEESWGFNPSNGEKLRIPAHYRIKFNPCPAVARRINKKYSILTPKVVEENQKIDDKESLFYKAEQINESKKSLLYKAGVIKESLDSEENKKSEDEISSQNEKMFDNPENLITPDLQEQSLNELEKSEEENKVENPKKNKKNTKLFVILGFGIALLLVLISVIIKSCTKKSEKDKNSEDLNSVQQETKVEETVDEKESAEIQDEFEISFEELIVKYGSTYHKIASEKYQNPHLWPYIYQANKMVSPDPDLIVSGKRLFIPAKPDLETQKEEICKSVLDAYNGYLLTCEKFPESSKNVRRKNLAVRVIVSGEILYPGFIEEYSSRILPEYADLAKRISKNQIK